MHGHRLGVLVGVDRSECSQDALDWAAQDAAGGGLRLTVAHVIDLPRIADVPLSSDLAAAATRGGKRTLDMAVVRSDRTHPGADIGRELASGNPATELLRLAADADEVVLGSRGHGGFASLLLGSTAAQVTAHAPCPVVVVRGRATSDGPVLVGVDGSDRSEAALEYGFGYASRHGLPVHALHCFSIAEALPPYGLPPIDLGRVRDEATLVVRQGVDRWSGKHPDVSTEWVVADGAPAYRLVEASEGASLLVVGCRGHGGIAGMLLGSVSQAAVRHAHCPVAVAR